MNVSTWLICALTSFVPSATTSFDVGETCPPVALAPLVMAAIHPWSAAGAEKPMVICLPALSLPLLAA